MFIGEMGTMQQLVSSGHDQIGVFVILHVSKPDPQHRMRQRRRRWFWQATFTAPLSLRIPHHGLGTLPAGVVPSGV
ncbi:MAG: hypothetical protein ACK55E_10315 [Cyanobacteriota bacterium]